jgi:hypothetical protein
LLQIIAIFVQYNQVAAYWKALDDGKEKPPLRMEAEDALLEFFSKKIQVWDSTFEADDDGLKLVCQEYNVTVSGVVGVSQSISRPVNQSIR